MIGTLVVSLPSSHTGGELVIEHNGTSVAYQASPTDVSVAAFYADCRHEIKPVRTGYRVTFTCHLLLEADPVGDAPAEPSAEAAGISPSTSPPRPPGGKATTGSPRTGLSTCWTTSTPSAG